MRIKLLRDQSYAEEMFKVNNAAFGYAILPNISKYEIQQCINNKRYDVYIIPDMNYIIGFLIVDNEPGVFILSPKEKRIEHFSVLPWKQGKGVGKTILSHVVNVVHPNDSFNLCVEATNKAVFLYKKLGFVDYGSNYITKDKYYIAMGLIR